MEQVFMKPITKDCSMKEIKLYRSNKKVKVDDDKYEELKKYNWLKSHEGYARRVEIINGKQVMTLMHRQIIGAKKGQIVNHKNMDRLDNRIENLRIANMAENSMNRKKQKGKYASIFKGVHMVSKPWRAVITVNNRQISLGTHKTEKEAAKAYNEAAVKYFGEYANLNET